jgi:hypothetical protein
MTRKRLVVGTGALALVALLGLLVVGGAMAQTATPSAPSAPTIPWGEGRGMGFFGGGMWKSFDAIAQALNLTPTQLFEELHSGKSLADIATAKGVDLAKVQQAMQADRIQAMKDAVTQAVKDGKITQEQADWLLQGLEKGYMPRGWGKGFGFGRGMGGHMRGFGGRMNPEAPADQTPGTSF